MVWPWPGPTKRALVTTQTTHPLAPGFYIFSLTSSVLDFFSRNPLSAHENGRP